MFGAISVPLSRHDRIHVTLTLCTADVPKSYASGQRIIIMTQLMTAIALHAWILLLGSWEGDVASPVKIFPQRDFNGPGLSCGHNRKTHWSNKS